VNAAAIIVAGGQGLRFGGPVRKQYLMLKGHPIVWWSLAAFDRTPEIGEIILVVPPDDVARVHKISRRWRIRKLVAVVPGGVERRDSVRQGLDALSRRVRWVAVHDAVRPLVAPATIRKTLRAAKRSGAALAASPSRDTVKLADPWGHVHTSPPRQTVWLAQTPQVFRRDWLERAHARGSHLPVTDDAQLVERLGLKVRLVESPAENMKVTKPIDLVFARAILARRAAR
jgi:2-C-methyl-D-erythritol 4-phosphate cytidylyltransferase